MPLPTEEQPPINRPVPRAESRAEASPSQFMGVGATEAHRGAGICSEPHSRAAVWARTQVP